MPGGALFNRQLAELRQAEPRQPDTGGSAAYSGAPTSVTVQRGDTLTSLVRAQWQAQGGARGALSAQEAHRWAIQVARDNGLSDPDRIRVGQTLMVAPLQAGRAPGAPVLSAIPHLHRRLNERRRYLVRGVGRKR